MHIFNMQDNHLSLKYEIILIKYTKMAAPDKAYKIFFKADEEMTRWHLVGYKLAWLVSH